MRGRLTIVRRLVRTRRGFPCVDRDPRAVTRVRAPAQSTSRSACREFAAAGGAPLRAGRDALSDRRDAFCAERDRGRAGSEPPHGHREAGREARSVVRARRANRRWRHSLGRTLRERDGHTRWTAVRQRGVTIAQRGIPRARRGAAWHAGENSETSHQTVASAAVSQVLVREVRQAARIVSVDHHYNDRWQQDGRRRWTESDAHETATLKRSTGSCRAAVLAALWWRESSGGTEGNRGQRGEFQRRGRPSVSRCAGNVSFCRRISDERR
jgi:hypothetical protein